MKKIYYLLSKCMIIFLMSGFVSIAAHAQSGLSLNFDGVNDYVQTPVLLPASYTKEAWVKLNSYSANNVNMVSGGETSGRHAFWIPNGFLSGGHNGSYVDVQDPTFLLLNTWYHVAITYDAPSTTMKLYKNGSLVSTSITVPAFANGQAVNIGAFVSSAPTAFLNGSLDNISIWNTVLSATEIMNRKNCQLIGTEPGLLAYYKFNQGVGGGNNAGITTLTNSSSTSGLDGTLINFALMGSTSNWQTSTPVTPSIATTNVTQTLSVSGTTVFNSSTCSDLITTVVANGVSPINGNTTAKVFLEASQPSQFVKRHYEITPDANSTTATGTVTLYFTQQEFDDFNADAANTLKLPTSPADASGVANLRVEKRLGVSGNGSGLPNSYTGTPTTIDPVDTDIVWNSDVNRWMVSFAVSGFSGFFVKTVTTLLPLRWLSVTGIINGQNQSVLNWQVQEHNVINYVVEKSEDANNFEGIATLNSKGDGTNSYNFTDAATLNGTGYFRIKQIDRDRRSSFSPVIKLSNNKNRRFAVYPNPVKDIVSVSGATVGSTAILTDVSGKPLQQIKIKQSAFIIDMSTYSSGVYVLKTDNGITQKIIKQ